MCIFMDPVVGHGRGGAAWLYECIVERIMHRCLEERTDLQAIRLYSPWTPK